MKYVDVQFIPVRGFAAGFLHYNPRQEPDIEEVAEEDYYEQYTIMFFLFAIHITVWWE